MRLPVNTVIHTTLVGLEPATFRSLDGCWSDALPVVPPHHLFDMFVHRAQIAEDIKMISCAYDSSISLPDRVKIWRLNRSTLPAKFCPKVMHSLLT